MEKSGSETNPLRANQNKERLLFEVLLQLIENDLVLLQSLDPNPDRAAVIRDNEKLITRLIIADSMRGQE